MSEATETRKPSSILTVGFASLIGTSIEWYDFFIFASAAALVFPGLFFPKLDAFTALLGSFGIFWVGFLGRPIGGIIFGHFGDRIGRKTMLVLTLTIMGLATFLVGVAPTFSSLGYWAAILLVILRLCQGIAVGGEWGGAVLMATEHAPANRRGFFGSWPQVGVPVGLILSSLLFSWVSGRADFIAFSWRIPFLLSIILVAVGLFVRLSVQETPDFERVKRNQDVVKMPIITVLAQHWKTVLLAAGAFFVVNGSFYLYVTQIVSYGKVNLHVPASVLFNATLVGAIVSFFVLPLAGAISDRIGRRPIFLVGAVLTLVLAFPIYALIDTRSPLLIVLAVSIGQFSLSLMYGPQAALFSEMFGTNVRYSGASLGYQGASILAGGLAPTIATILLQFSGGASWPIAVYLMVMAVITLVSVYFIAETRPVAVPEITGGVATGD